MECTPALSFYACVDTYVRYVSVYTYVCTLSMWFTVHIDVYIDSVSSVHCKYPSAKYHTIVRVRICILDDTCLN